MLKDSQRRKTIYKPLVPAVEQASRVLLCLGESRHFKMRLTEICQEVGIHKSKGHSILNTLIQFGFIEKDPHTKTYSLGPGLIFLSRKILDRLSYPEVVAPFLENLAKETNGTAIFGWVNENHVYVVEKHEGNQNIGFTLRLGHRFHITLGAHGKAIVAFMPDKEREKILAKKRLHFYGEASELNMNRLKGELVKCRRLGFAQDKGEVTPGVNVVSSPIFGLGEEIIGCIMLMGTFLESKMDEFGNKVAGIAKQISYKLGANVEAIYPTT
jgi:DNA-binding IclR family transcriptional regulator